MSRQQEMSNESNKYFDMESNMKPLKDKENLDEEQEEEEYEHTYAAFASLFEVEELEPGPGREPSPLSAESNVQSSVNNKPKNEEAWISRKFRPISPLNFEGDVEANNRRIQETLEAYPPPRTETQLPAMEYMETKPMVLDADEVQALENWVEMERLNEPLSDIPEYKLLLNLASEHKQNYELLFKILTPTAVSNTPAKEAKKPLFGQPVEPPEKLKQTQAQAAPSVKVKVEPDKPSTSKEAMKVLQLSGKVKIIHPGPAGLAKPSSGAQVGPWTVHPPVQVELPSIPRAVPKPPQPSGTDDVKKNIEWLQLCNYVVTEQVKFTEAKDKIEKECNKGVAVSLDKLAPDQTTPTTVIFDEEILGYSKLQAKILSAKWLQQFGRESLNNLRRIVVTTTSQTVKDHRLSAKIRIIRRPTKREVISVDMKYTNVYCTLNLNTNLNLRNITRLLDCAHYKHGIDVIQQTFDTIRLAWIWPNGAVMIINGTTQAALVETETKLLPKLTEEGAPKAQSIKTFYARLVSHAKYPWPIDLAKFSQAESLTGPLYVERYVYYVHKDLPAVVARLHESGEVHVYAMATALADNILSRLYPIALKHRVMADQKESLPSS